MFGAECVLGVGQHFAVLSEEQYFLKMDCIFDTFPRTL